MIITQTPFRVSLFGGGTDYPTWFREHGGDVLSFSINKYCYISCRHLPPFFEHKHRIVYSTIEAAQTVDAIKHLSVRAVLKYLNVNEGLEIHHDGDLPARSGIGSSSSFTVGLLNTLYAMRGEIISKKELAKLAIHIEQNVIQETVGSQDQIAAAYGGFNRIRFNMDDTFTVHPVVLKADRRAALQKNLMLFFTGFSRTAEVIAKSKIENFKSKTSSLFTMRGFVEEAVSVLQSSQRSNSDIGRLLHETWRLKRELSDKVSNSSIDEIYEAGLSAGALGGKVLGAGGGGFVLFYVEEGSQQKVREKLQRLIEVPFDFDNYGSRLVLYDPNFGGQETVVSPRPPLSV